MPIRVDVKVKGAEEVINKIQKFNDIAYSELGQKMYEVVDDFITDAKYFAPIDTGYLRDHITGRIISKARGVVIIGRIRSSASYSIYNEFGTSKMEANPFMMPAFNKNKFRMYEKFKRAMETAIQKAVVGKYYGGGTMVKGHTTGSLETTLSE